MQYEYNAVVTTSYVEICVLSSYHLQVMVLPNFM